MGRQGFPQFHQHITLFQSRSCWGDLIQFAQGLLHIVIEEAHILLGDSSKHGGKAVSHALFLQVGDHLLHFGFGQFDSIGVGCKLHMPAAMDTELDGMEQHGDEANHPHQEQQHTCEYFHVFLFFL